MQYEIKDLADLAAHFDRMAQECEMRAVRQGTKTARTLAEVQAATWRNAASITILTRIINEGENHGR